MVVMVTRPYREPISRRKDGLMSRPIAWSETVTFFEDDWHEGNVPIMGPRTHAAVALLHGLRRSAGL